MKTLLIALLLAGCANRRHIPVAAVPVDAVSPYEHVIANWGPAHNCKEIRNFKYCEIDGKGIVAFKNNTYFATLDKEKDEKTYEVHVLTKGEAPERNKKVYMVPKADQSWHLYHAFFKSILSANGYEVVNNKREGDISVNVDYGQGPNEKFLTLNSTDKRKKHLWNIFVETTGHEGDLKSIMPALATVASDSFRNQPDSAITEKLTSNSVPVKAFHHYSTLVEDKKEGTR